METEPSNDNGPFWQIILQGLEKQFLDNIKVLFQDLGDQPTLQNLLAAKLTNGLPRLASSQVKSQDSQSQSGRFLVEENRLRL